jgi:hypothetical protein
MVSTTASVVVAAALTAVSGLASITRSMMSLLVGLDLLDVIGKDHFLGAQASLFADLVSNMEIAAGLLGVFAAVPAMASTPSARAL